MNRGQDYWLLNQQQLGPAVVVGLRKKPMDALLATTLHNYTLYLTLHCSMAGQSMGHKITDQSVKSQILMSNILDLFRVCSKIM